MHGNTELTYPLTKISNVTHRFWNSSREYNKPTSVRSQWDENICWASRWLNLYNGGNSWKYKIKSLYDNKLRQVWEGMLTELSKVNAPSMLLQDFNYFFNKAINQYINKRYNIYDVNQQTTDDLRVLKATSILGVRKATDSEPLAALINYGAGKSKLLDATYEVNLP